MATPRTLPARPARAVRTYHSVNAMLRRTGSRRIAAAVKSLAAQTVLVDQLVLARVAAGFTQAQLASKMRCTQSRISKLEDSADADLRLGDIQAYAQAIGLTFNLGILR